MTAILVTGATGFLGQHLVQHLLAAGESVRVFARSRERALPLVQQGAELAQGEITDRAALATALQGIQIVYHLAGRLFEPGVPAEEYLITHVAGTQAVLNCALDSKFLKRFVHTSTTGVIGAPMASPQDESAPAAPTNAYEEAKWLGEQLVREAITAGCPACIVRPGLVYGPGDLHLLGFFRTIQRGLFRPIGPQPVWLHPIFIDDMTRGFVCCGEHSAAVGECFNIANPEPVAIGDLAGEIASALGKSRPSGTIPLPVGRFAAGVGELLPGRLQSIWPLARTRLDFLTQSRMYDVRRAKRMVDFVAQTDLPTGIALTVNWYRSKGYL